MPYHELCHSCLFFFNDTATTEIYTLSLHDALPISVLFGEGFAFAPLVAGLVAAEHAHGLLDYGELEKKCAERQDRKSTRLNSSHANISYAVFCLKKKKTPSLR